MFSRHRRRRAWIRIALVLALGWLSAASLAAAPETLRIGYQKSSVTLALARASGELEKRFPGTRVSWIEFPSGPPLLEALGAGSLDLGMTGDAPPIFAQAAQSAIVYIGVEPPKPESSAILVTPDSTIHDLADLKGKRIAFQKGSSAHYLVLSALAQAHLAYTEITPVYLSPADARAAFLRGDIEAWAIWDPYYAAAETGVPHRVLSNGRGLSDDNSFYLATRAFVDAQPEVITRFLDGLNAARKWREQQPQRALQLVADATGLDAATTAIFVGRHPQGAILPLTPSVIATQQRIADAFFAARLIPRAIHVEDIVWQSATATQ